MDKSTNKTHFGYQEVSTEKKQSLVDDVFSKVSNHYDLMNDLMSCGIHRLWKDTAIQKMNLSRDHHVLDLAGGTGDLSKRILKHLNHSAQLCLADYNHSMLEIGQKNLLNMGYIPQIVAVDGHQLPFPENTFDQIIVGFGLRNMTDQPRALSSMMKSLKKGGQLTILEFTTPTNEWFAKIYDWYSFNVIPKIGQMITQSSKSYEYLVESIRMHPDAPSLKLMMENTGFKNCSFSYLTQGIVAIHQGEKL